MPLSPGSRLSPYEILDSLGAGGMGEVYRARDSKLGRDAAIRILPPVFLDDPVEVHPSGAFVYVSNRGHNSIAAMHIDQSTGAPSLIEAFPLGGNNPRSFNIDPAGGYLFAMLQRSNAIVPLRIDPQTGRLSRSGENIPLPAPVCAKFVEVG